MSRPRFAYYSPLNIRTSGVASYSLDLLPFLRRSADMDIYLDDPTIDDPQAVAGLPIIGAGQPSPDTRYDASIYHIGNGMAHAYVYKALIDATAAAGKKIVVLHDYVLQHLFSGYWDAATYTEVMRRQYGVAGAHVAGAMLSGQQPPELFSMPLNETVIAAADMVLVHSHYAADLLRARYPDLAVAIVPMGVPLLDVGDPMAARRRLGLSADAFVMLSLGHLSPYKRIEQVLSAFGLFVREQPNSLFVLVGTHSPGFDVLRAIRIRDLEDRVRVVGFADDAAMQDYITAADVCVNLRYPTVGETSASLLRLMSAGRPVLVSDVAAYAEMPDDCAVKIGVDPNETGEILAYLRVLANNRLLRQTIGANARRSIATQHRLEVSAAAYMRSISGHNSVVAPSADPPPAPLPPYSDSRRSGPRPVTKGNRQQESYSLPSFAGEASERATAREGLGMGALKEELARAIAELGLDPDDPSDRAGAIAVSDVARTIAELGLS